ncbi:beta-galactosidase [Virgisporangium ochraceum]|uniref:Glycoside hydrolase n=1 Tax=Virgisporangium ochraceum TaxID=65505 RepID=A0A8J4E8J9_9ACTN|nr:beta-galactosidase [Virgisporangium ochraceum]GIJ65756.1 glycoside hydrolase [Virgisporangium ochraceum]
MSQVELRRRRILIDGRPQLVLSGEVHYFRLDPGDWSDRLDKLREAGCDTVATYIPWLWHELPDRGVDLTGRTHPRRDVAGFLDLAHGKGLRAIARPGPFVMAELKNEGVPYRLYTDTPHLQPTTWDGGVVPTRTLDYLAADFLAAAEGWYAAVMPMLAARLAPRGGPVIGVQLDNEIGMLSWVSNSPDLPDERFHHPTEDRSLAVHDELGRYMRDRYRRYVAFLRDAAIRQGVDGVPFLINVHGTDEGRGRTFPIGISQLFESYRGVPQLTAGSDHYLGDLTVGNAPDLYTSNAFLAASLDADQPLTSLEFEAGSGDYAEDLSQLVPPQAVDLKTRMCVAQGNRLLNLYLFTGGRNPLLDRPVGDGNDRIAFTGERHGFAAPVDPEGRCGAAFSAVRDAFAAVRGASELLADGDEEDDGFALAFVPDHYLTEYHHPASSARAEQVADLARFRGMGPRDILARSLLLAGYSFPAVDVQSPGALPPVLVLASASTLGRAVQERLAAYVSDGGRLLLNGVLPRYDADGAPCTALADALGVRVTGRVDGTPHYFPSVVADGRPEVRVGYAQYLAGGDPVLRVAGSEAVCGVRVHHGAGVALLVATDYPAHLDFWRTCMATLGVTPRLRHDAAEPGLLLTSTVDTSGQRLLHVLNLGPSDADFALSYRDRPVLTGRRLHVPARAGVMLPYGVGVGTATLLETTCELVARTGDEVVLRPTQGPHGDLAVFDRDPADVDGGTADGPVVTATDARVRVRF